MIRSDFEDGSRGGWQAVVLTILIIGLGWLTVWLVWPARDGARAAVPDQVALANRSGAVALTANGRYLLAVNPDSHTLSLVDPATLTLLAEIPVGEDPRSVATSPYGDDLAYVVNQGSDSLTMVDLATRQAITTLAVGRRPVDVVVAPNGRYLALAELGDDQIRFLDSATLRTLAVRPVADRPHGLAFTPDGAYLLITHLLDGHVTVLPNPPAVAYLPLVGRSGDAKSVASLTAAPPNQLATWPHVAPAPGIVVNTAGTRAYLPQTMANGLGLNTQFDTTVFPKVSVLNLGSWQHQTQEHVPLPESDQPVGLPWDVGLTRGDTELWVVNAASNDLSVIDISQPELPRRAAHIPVGANPRAIAFGADGRTAYVNNTLDGTLSVIDAQTYTVTTEIALTTIPLPPLLLAGKQLFHSSADPRLAQARWIACTTCHVEGEHDGRTWELQFTDPLTNTAAGVSAIPTLRRNTTSLLGMVETYPLRWSAEWDESADSEFSVRFEQFGSGLIAGEMHPTLGAPNQGRSAELDSLAAFLDSLQVPDSQRPLNAAAQRGQLLFESPTTGCATCHPPPLYTNLQAYDVGTAEGSQEHFGPIIDTPTLRFLADSPPYLHDGSAATLRAVLTTHNPDDRHGTTSHLSEGELADLIAFLQALPFK